MLKSTTCIKFSERPRLLLGKLIVRTTTRRTRQLFMRCRIISYQTLLQ